jgi:FkbM family methyltransferase
MSAVARQPSRRPGAIFSPAIETALKEEFFRDTPRGFFVEVGANDPHVHSQTWEFEQAGWGGILIEPLPGLADVLRRCRSATVFAVACTSPQRAGQPMRIYLAGPYSSVDPDLMVAEVRAGGSIEVPAQTLDDILSEAGAPVPIDFISLDVEGHENEVLAGFNIARWRPRLILIEDHIVNLRKHRWLQQAGYRLIRRTGLNSWYVPDAAAGHIDWVGRWQLFRKYYLGLPFRVLRDALRRMRPDRRG